MFKFFEKIKERKELRDFLKCVCQSINFDDCYNRMPTLEFEYSMNGNLLVINGPINSLHNLEKYEIIYDKSSKAISLNNIILNSSQFKFFHKTIYSVYEKLIRREDFIKSVMILSEKLKGIPLNTNENHSSSDCESRRSRNSDSNRRSDSRSTRDNDDD